MRLWNVDSSQDVSFDSWTEKGIEGGTFFPPKMGETWLWLSDYGWLQWRRGCWIHKRERIVDRSLQEQWDPKLKWRNWSSYEGRHVHYDWREQGKEWIWIIEKTKLLMSCVVSNAILLTQYCVSCFWGSDWGWDRGYVPAQPVLELAKLFAWLYPLWSLIFWLQQCHASLPYLGSEP